MASGASVATRVRIGRPVSPHLTEATIRSLASKIASGIPMKAAAGSIGVPYRTFQHWLENGRRPGAEEPYASLAVEVDLAIDRYHASRIVQLHRVGRDDPKVIMWELERRFPSDWADHEKGGVTVNVGVITASPEWAALRDRALEALARHPEALADYLAAIGASVVVEGEIVAELTE